ncbi:MAG: STAS/SEC14 domain-containing protein [Deltaproteobacteria bacterium]|nr:STAS/SEC14 domain-containing protein [Deltaproteobacteria bacterium]
MTAIDPTEPGALETRSSIWRLRQDGLLHSVVKPGAHHTLEDAVANVEACRTLSPGRRRPLLVDIRQGPGVDRAARTYYAGPEGAGVATATALLVGSPTSRIVANFFLGLNRMQIPLRLFTDEEAAVAWLRGYLE